MAKSRGFFTLRRGSTKSLTFSVLKGKQITKDRVVEVRNPKSAAQALQRMKFASLSSFLAAFRSVIERANEKLAYGSDASQFFTSFNAKNIAVQGYRKGSGFLPIDCQVAFGTLDEITALVQGENTLMTEGVEQILGNTVGALRVALHAEIGDQLTILLAVSTGGKYVPVWDSFYFKPEYENIVIAEGEGWDNVEWVNGGRVNMEPTENQKAFFTTGDMFGDDPIVNGCIILSRDGDGKHLRSNARFSSASGLGVYNANSIILGRNSFMGIGNLSSDWPVEAGDAALDTYRIIGVRYAPEERPNSPTTVAVLEIQHIEGNSVTTEKKGIFQVADGANMSMYPINGDNMPLQLGDYPWQGMSAVEGGEPVPTSFISYADVQTLYAYR